MADVSAQRPSLEPNFACRCEYNISWCSYGNYSNIQAQTDSNFYCLKTRSLVNWLDHVVIIYIMLWYCNVLNVKTAADPSQGWNANPCPCISSQWLCTYMHWCYNHQTIYVCIPGIVTSASRQIQIFCYYYNNMLLLIFFYYCHSLFF